MSGLVLPTYSGGAANWSFVDWIDVRRQTAPAAGGVADLQLDQLEPDEMWLLDHAVIQGGAGSVVRLYDSTVDPTALLDGSDQGAFDVAEWPNGLRLGPARWLAARWSFMPDGAVGTLSLQARQFRRS
jgi:hypothetical protein